MDEDNIAGSFKPLIDGLKDAGIISDDKKECVVHREYRWAKAPQGEGRVQISILELQETNGGEDQCGS
jgi:Holliday junction resolvase RusA-like endonuclease